MNPCRVDMKTVIVNPNALGFDHAAIMMMMMMIGVSQCVVAPLHF